MLTLLVPSLSRQVSILRNPQYLATPWHTRPKQSAAFEWEWDSGLDETAAWIRLCCVRFLLSRLERDRPAGLGKPAAML